MKIPAIKPPAIHLVKTIGGYYRAYIHGLDSLNNNGLYVTVEIASSETKEDCLRRVNDWFSSMEVVEK